MKLDMIVLRRKFYSLFEMSLVKNEQNVFGCPFVSTLSTNFASNLIPLRFRPLVDKTGEATNVDITRYQILANW